MSLELLRKRVQGQWWSPQFRRQAVPDRRPWDGEVALANVGSGPPPDECTAGCDRHYPTRTSVH